MCLEPPLSQPKLGQIEHVGGVVKLSGTADSKSSLENWPRFMEVIEQNEILNSLCQYCTRPVVEDYTD